MKRKTRSTSHTSIARPRAIAAHRLTAVRGGITVEVVTPPPSVMQQQHNETLLRLPPHARVPRSHR